MKHATFGRVLTAFFLITVALELYGVLAHDYTLSDFILCNLKMKWRIGILAFLVYHFIFEYPTYR
jgi:hypothetical protein